MDSTSPRTDLAPLRRWERLGLGAFALLLVVFGAIVEVRCVLLTNRQTDLGVYLRAAWAVRNGENPYNIHDENGWHYCYPPVVALLLTPLADAPPGAPRPLMFPWAVLVIIWYLISVASIFLAVHWIAGVLESRASDPAIRAMPAFCRRWWYDRTIPIFICLIQIGSTLSRGQVNLMVILFVAGSFAALVKSRQLRSGLWLGAAICLKVIPAFLLLFPLWRRDGRTLAGVAVSLAIGLFGLPALYWGPAQALSLDMQMVDAVIHPGLGKGGDQTRALELTNLNATDNQSFQSILHNYQYWGRLDQRPGQAAPWTRMAHWAISGLLTIAVLLAAGWRRHENACHSLLFLGSLFLVMTMVTPVSHLHYFSMALPLIMALLGISLQGRVQTLFPRPAMLTLLLFAAIGYALPTLPIWPNRREAGLPILVSFVLLGVSMLCMRAIGKRPESIGDQVTFTEVPISHAA